MQRKILVIGSAGLLGSYLTKYLEEKAYQVKGVDSEKLDITDEKKLSEFFKKNNFSTVINCAAITKVDDVEDELYEIALKVNGEAPGYLSKILSEKDIDLVHISTDYVNNSNDPHGFDEGTTMDIPMNRYGETKLLGERELASNWRNNSKAKYFIVRTQWLFGPYANNFIAKITKFGRELDELKVVDDEFGCPTYIKDLSAGIVELIENDHECGIYHISSDNFTSRYEFAKKILELQKIYTPIVPTKLADFQRKAKINNYSILLNTKLPHRRKWEEMLEDFFSEHKL